MLLEMEERTGITPKAILDRPELYGSAKEVAKAFEFFDSRRTSSGFGASPINLDHVWGYIDRYGVETLSEHDFLYLLNLMDKKRLEHLNGNRTSNRQHNSGRKRV